MTQPFRIRLARTLSSLAALICSLGLAATPAAARDAYVANSGNGTVSVLDPASGAGIATIAVGGKPVDVAISPDGSHAYVVDEQRNLVIGIDTATNAVFAGIPVGKEPRGIAIAPSGSAAYVTDFGDGTLSVLDLATSTRAAAIAVGAEPEGVAVSPDATHAYVARRGGGVAIVDLAAARVVGVVPDSLGPSRLSLTPDGSRALVTNAGASSVSLFDPASGQGVGAPIPVPSPPAGIAVAPSGRYAYAASPKAGAVSVIDTATATAAGTIGALPGASGIAIEPGGARGIATAAGGASASIFDTAAGRGLGSVAVGPEPQGVAVVPDQGPQASFRVFPPVRFAKRKLSFQAGASSDPDGKIATYAWNWGDGHHVKTTTGFKRHRYASPGDYVVTLTLTDAEGCSTEQIFTGQTASCNGSSRAVASVPIEVLNPRVPGLHLAAGRRQRVRGVVNLFAKCPIASCGLRARGTVIASFRRRGARHRRRGPTKTYTLHVGPQIVSATARAWTRLPLQLPRGRRRAVLRALRNGGSARAELTVLARDVHGISQIRHRVVRLVARTRRSGGSR